MPKYPYRKIGVSLNRDFRNNQNANLEDIAADIAEQKSRVDAQIANVPQPSEVVDARVDTSGTEHATLKDRLDSGDQNTASQLADKVNKGALGKIKGQLSIAHRGFGSVYPQNTRAAFEGAAGCGADVLETDIYATTDGVFICSHDNDLSMMTAGTGSLVSQSSTTILSYPITQGQNFNLYPGMTLCTLDELLQIAKRYNKIAMPEFKTDNMTWTTDLFNSVISKIYQYGMQDRIILQSFGLDVLTAFRQINKDISLLYLVNSVDQTAINSVLSLGNCCLGVNASGLTDAAKLSPYNCVKRVI